eukprot:UN17004
MVHFAYEVSGELKVKCPDNTDPDALVDGLIAGIAEIMDISQEQVSIDMDGSIFDPIHFIIFMDENLKSSERELKLLQMTEEELNAEEE